MSQLLIQQYLNELHRLERSPKDPTIRATFNSYRLADYKEKVIDLVLRVTTVSVETQKVLAGLPSERRDGQGNRAWREGMPCALYLGS